MKSLRCGCGRSASHSGRAVNGDFEILFSSLFLFVSGSWAIFIPHHHYDAEPQLRYTSNKSNCLLVEIKIKS